MKPRDLPLFRDEEARKLLVRACRQHGVTFPLLKDLLTIQREQAGRGRQHGITEEFRNVIEDFLESRGE